MIYDSLCNWRRYVPHREAELFCQAIEFLRTFTPDSEVGKHVLKEGLIYVNVQEYTPKNISEAVIEYHRDFVDLQTVFSGVENICYAPLALLKEKAYYNAADDYGLYEFDPAAATTCYMEPGNFVIFHPGEGHAPCIAASDNPDPVKKAVLKIHHSIFE